MKLKKIEDGNELWTIMREVIEKHNELVDYVDEAKRRLQNEINQVHETARERF